MSLEDLDDPLRCLKRLFGSIVRRQGASIQRVRAGSCMKHIPIQHAFAANSPLILLSKVRLPTIVIIL